MNNTALAIILGFMIAGCQILQSGHYITTALRIDNDTRTTSTTG